MSERDASYGMPDADGVPEDTTPGGPPGEIQPDDEDTSGGPISSGAGPGAAQGAPDLDEGDAIGGGGERFEG